MNQNISFLNENNWEDIFSNIDSFPFRVSELKQINKEQDLKRISFKYNLSGKEFFKNNGKEIYLKSGEYLISTNQSKCEVLVNEPLIDIGICIDIDEEILCQAIQSIVSPNYLIDEPMLENYFTCSSLFHKFTANSFFKKYMVNFFGKIKSEDYLSINELKFEFVRVFIGQHLEYVQYYKNIKAMKQNTRNELYERMLMAKSMIDNSVYSNISISDIVKEVYLSPYRFHHVFKDTFRISPYRYLISLKLNEAINLAEAKKLSWTEISEILHFSDIQSFSKIFKKYYGKCPSEFQFESENSRMQKVFQMN